MDPKRIYLRGKLIFCRYLCSIKFMSEHPHIFFFNSIKSKIKIFLTLVCCVDVFDVNLTSFCRHFVDALTSIWCQNFHQISHQFSHQMLTEKIDVINYLTKIWLEIDINLTWHWCHFNIISTSPMMLSMTSSWHQNIDVILMVKSLVNFDINFHIKC